MTWAFPVEVNGMKINIGPIELRRDIELNRDLELNPGLGGSEFYFIRLAIELESLGAEVAVTVAGSTLKIHNTSIRILPAETLLDDIFDANVAIASTSSYSKYSGVLNKAQNLVLVSHHPHDGDLRKIARTKIQFVCVNLGEYQFLSNYFKQVPSVIIPAFVAPPATPISLDRSTYVFGHLSSMVPSKGFHHIAKGWVRIAKKNSSARLQVLGGVSLYGNKESHPRLPTTYKYGQKIEKILDKESKNDSVSFLGRIPGSIEEYLANWKIALLNPKGIAEADPSSVKDCMRHGVPVIAGFDYGIRFYLREFPELQLRRSAQLSKVVASILEDGDLLERLSLKTYAFYDELYKRNPDLRESWALLLADLVEGRGGRFAESRLLRNFEWREGFIFKCIIIFRSKVYYPVLNILASIQSRLSKS
jgi:glycosyltransferase involved in cell wall biosynthesis